MYTRSSTHRRRTLNAVIWSVLVALWCLIAITHQGCAVADKAAAATTQPGVPEAVVGVGAAIGGTTGAAIGGAALAAGALWLAVRKVVAKKQ